MVKKLTRKTKKASVNGATYSPRTMDDVKTAILLVSVTINVAVFVAWLAIKITTDYDAQVLKFLFDR